MLRIHTCLSVHCDHCGTTLGSPDREEHYRGERAARRAAIAQRWRAGSSGRLLCSACTPVLTCEAEGHQFGPWRHPLPPGRGLVVVSEYRYCRRCCELESRPATGPGRDEGESR